MLGRVSTRRGRPGLIGTAARTAVVAGTATAVSGRVAQRQMERHAAAQSAAEPAHAPAHDMTQAHGAAAGPAMPGRLDDEAISQVERLGSLHSQGLLTDEEFSAAKKRIIGI